MSEQKNQILRIISEYKKVDFEYFSTDVCEFLNTKEPFYVKAGSLHEALFKLFEYVNKKCKDVFVEYMNYMEANMLEDVEKITYKEILKYFASSFLKEEQINFIN